MQELTPEEIRTVYRTMVTKDFPDSELKPLAVIEAQLRRGEYRCLGLKESGSILAYAFFVDVRPEKERILLLDYFAVRQELRGHGIGSRALAGIGAALREDTCCAFAEVDDPDAAEGDERGIRLRRLHFYRKNGLRDTGARCRTFGVDYRILAFPDSTPHSPAEVCALYESVYRSFLPAALFGSMIRTRAEA